MPKKIIGFYVDNSHTKVDFTKVHLGNPGVGYSEYLPIALTFFLTKNYFNYFKYILFSHNTKNMPKKINCIKVDSIVDAADKAKKLQASVFVFRTRINQELQILNHLERLKLLSIGIAQLTPSPKHIDEIENCKYLRALVCVGREQYDSLLDTRIINKLSVIENAVFEDQYSFSSLKDKKTKSVVYLGALVHQKGFHYLAKAWPNILKVVPSAKLEVIGSNRVYGDKLNVGKFSPAEPEFEKKFLAKYLTDINGNLIKSVKFWGRKGIEKNKIISKSLVGVANPSGSTETCCVSAVELSASKLPVVSGAYNALLDTVIHKKTGLLGKNTMDLERNIILLLSNPQISHKMGVEGKKYIKKKFSFKVIAPKWIKIINAVIFDKPIEKPKSKIKNIFRHKKFLRVINSYISFLVPMKWPSIYHLEKKLWHLKNWFFRKL
jgi:glycosyltransferase involved in cell wall biosynthesis